ncbi:plant-specific TFIIB-related protein PTF2-like protein [Tanacetum coccineum]
MIKFITDDEYGMRNWFNVLVVACVYVVMHNVGKSLPLGSVCDVVGCNSYELGRMVSRVVQHLEINLPEFDIVGLFRCVVTEMFNKFCIGKEKLARMMQQGVFLLQCMIKWYVLTGRRPVLAVVVVVVFVCIDETKACEEMDSKSYSFDSSLSGTRVVDAQDDKSLPPNDPIYQDPERGFTGKDYKCSKTTRSTPRVAYSNRSNTPTRPPKSVCRDAFSRPYLNRPVEDGSGWSRNVLLQYLFVVILLILTIVPICVMNSPTVSHSEVGYKGFVLMMLMDENLSENMICYDHEKWDTKDLE